MNEEISSAVSLWHNNMQLLFANFNAAVIKRRLQKRRLQKCLIGCTSLCPPITFRIRKPNIVRSKDWWNRIVQTEYTFNDWNENFRMSEETLEWICEELEEILSPEQNPISLIENVVDAKKKVGIAVYYLSKRCGYGTIANQFGVHRSTVCKVVHEFIDAVNKILLPKFIRMPGEEEAATIAKEFATISNFPNVIGVIASTHIPIQAPSDRSENFLNSKGWTSLTMQAVIDDKNKFTDISIKSPGGMHNDAVLLKSNLFKNHSSLMPKGTVQIGKHSLPYTLIGNSSYPSLPWILKDYRNSKLSVKEKSFNANLNLARNKAEIAFSRFKARWRILTRQNCFNYNSFLDIIACCCTLHNILESRKEFFDPNWLQDLENYDKVFPQPDNISTDLNKSEISDI